MLAALFWQLWFLPVLLSQTHQVCGIVKNEAGDVMAKVQVCEDETQRCVTTNRKGEFCLNLTDSTKKLVLHNSVMLELLSEETLKDGKQLLLVRQMTTEDLFSLSVKELLEIEVTTASRFQAKLHDAPGAISVITSSEIERFGGASLFEVLNRMPNAISLIGHSLDVVTIRGGDFDPWNGRVSYLLDGNPVRNIGGNGSYYNLLHSFPLSRVKQIEIIRGPGSVTNGNNAFDGVINVITKDGGGPLLELTGSLGQNQTGIVDFSAGEKKEKLSFHIGGHYSNSKGQELYSEQNMLDTTTSFNIPLPNRQLSLNSKFQYQNLSLGIHAASSERGINNVFDSLFVPVYTEPRSGYEQLSYYTSLFIVRLQHQAKLSENVKMLNSISLNNELFKWFVVGTVPIYAEGRMYLAESEIRASLSPRLYMASGLEYMKLKSDFQTSLPDGYDMDFLSWFAELKFNLFDQLAIFTGAKYNKPLKYKGALVPRISALYEPFNSLAFKYSLAQAFHSPDPTQYLVDNRVAAPDGNVYYFDKGNPQLRPEIVTTHDFQILYSRQKLDFAIGLYFAKAKDLIASVPKEVDIGDTTVTYLKYRDNLDDMLTYGLELEGKFNFSRSWFASFSFVYNQNEFKGEIKDYTLAPNYQFKLGLSYAHKWFAASSFMVASDAFKDIAGIRNEAQNVVNINPDLNTYLNLSANICVHLDELFKGAEFPGTSLCFYGTNLLGTDLWQPDLYTYAIKSMPGMPQRHFTVSLKIKLF